MPYSTKYYFYTFKEVYRVSMQIWHGVMAFNSQAEFLTI
jgi:hypothetical protein